MAKTKKRFKRIIEYDFSWINEEIYSRKDIIILLILFPIALPLWLIFTIGKYIN